MSTSYQDATSLPIALFYSRRRGGILSDLVARLTKHAGTRTVLYVFCRLGDRTNAGTGIMTLTLLKCVGQGHLFLGKQAGVSYCISDISWIFCNEKPACSQLFTFSFRFCST